MLTIPSVTVLCAALAAFGGQRDLSAIKPDPNAVHAWLTRQGYTTAKLERRDEIDTRFVLAISAGKAELPLLLDTGAPCTHLDEAIVKKLTIPRTSEPERIVHWIDGPRLARQHQWDEFQLARRTLWDTRVISENLKGLLDNDHPKARRVDGLLGLAPLCEWGAVIDLGRPAVYLTDRRRREMERMVGEWRFSGGERDGVKVEGENWTLTFPPGFETATKRESDYARITDGTEKAPADGWGTFYYRIEYGRYHFQFRSQDLKINLPLFCQAGVGGLLERDGDRLRLCYTLPDVGAKEAISTRYPTTFSAKAGSRQACLTFERVGKGPPPPPSLAKCLADAGYTELPLERLSDENPCLILPVQVGKKSRRFLIDTGALRTALSDTTVRELGLKTVPVAKHPELPRRMDKFAVFKSAKSGTVHLPTVHAEVWDFQPGKDFHDMIGLDILNHFSAVIDCAKPALYILQRAPKK